MTTHMKRNRTSSKALFKEKKRWAESCYWSISKKRWIDFQFKHPSSSVNDTEDCNPSSMLDTTMYSWGYNSIRPWCHRLSSSPETAIIFCLLNTSELQSTSINILLQVYLYSIRDCALMHIKCKNVNVKRKEDEVKCISSNESFSQLTSHFRVRLTGPSL